jgi:endoglucanase
VVSWAEAHRLWIFLDLHCAPGGQNAGNISDSDGVARLYSDPRNQASTVLLWREIAARYQNRDAVGGYDLLNEPVWSSGADVAGLYRRLVDAVRAVDSRHLIILEGNTWATDLSIFGAPWDTNLSYSFHKYWDDTSDASIERFLSFSREWNVPLWLGETGENSADWYSSALGLVTRHGIGWCFWPWKKVWTDNDPLSVEPAPGTFSHITDYLDGKGPRPTRDETATGVRAMLRAATVESCRRNTDVIAVLQAN